MQASRNAFEASARVRSSQRVKGDLRGMSVLNCIQPYTRRNCNCIGARPVRAQRIAIALFRQRFTLREIWRSAPDADLIGFVVARLRGSMPPTVRVSSSASSRLSAADELIVRSHKGTRPSSGHCVLVRARDRSTVFGVSTESRDPPPQAEVDHRDRESLSRTGGISPDPEPTRIEAKGTSG